MEKNHKTFNMSSVVNEYKSTVSEENVLFIWISIFLKTGNKMLDLYGVILSLSQVKGILWQSSPTVFYGIHRDTVFLCIDVI